MYAFTIGAIVLNPMAYVDDLILFASSLEVIQKLLDRLHKGDVIKGDKAVRRAVRMLLRLPADCPNSAIHAPARFGGLGVNSLEMLYSTLKESRLF